LDDQIATLKRQLGELIAMPSVSSLDPALDTSNKEVVDLLSEWFERAGFSVERQLVDQNQGKWNLLASIGPGEDGLVLSGHTDTVPFDAERWSSDPFTLTERDGLWYGLGAADMKSFFPIVLAALSGLDPNVFKSPLTVLATADEESSMNGARRLLETPQPLGRYGLIGEPTGLRPVHMHKGIMLTAIEVVGRSGHSSDPGLGNNALEGMHRVISGLLTWRDELQRRYADPGFEIPQPTMNLGCIRGGDNPNRICASCELQLDLRVLPEMDVDELAGDLQRIVGEAVAGSGLAASVKPLMQAVPPLHTSAEAEMVRVAEALTGTRAATVAFGTEAPFLTALGVETIVLGPGDIDQAHQPDEFVSVARMVEMVAILGRFIEHFCCHARIV
jgi:acetylornithine deacetylase